MANVCTFEMRIRGTKENCHQMVNSDIPCYDAYIVSENGTADDYMLYLEGECRWSVTGSMVNTNEAESLAAKAKKYNIELEVFGYDKSEPEWVEHYHYKGGKCLKAYNLPPYFMEWSLEEMELSDEDIAKYEHLEEKKVYVLKKEFEEKFEWDEDNYRMNLCYEMSFRNLPGFEDYKDEDCNSQLEKNSFGDKSAILEMMGIFPDDDGFAISHYEDDSTVLFEYFGTEKKIIVPDGVTEIETRCFEGIDTAEEIYLPETVMEIGENCFINCPNLRIVAIPASVERFAVGDDSFSGSEKVKVYTPIGSAAEKFAKEHNIPVVAD